MTPPVILALDTATVTGFCHGSPGDIIPIWGVKDFGARRCNGEVIFNFGGWLTNLCLQIKPDLITFESPYVPRGGRWATMNPLTLRRLMALAGEVEAVAWALKIKVYEATALDIARFFIGTSALKREAKKAATIVACARYGWVTASDDAADALALWALAEATIAPDIAAARAIGPLMMRPPPIKNANTPEDATPGRSGSPALVRKNANATESFNFATRSPQGKIRSAQAAK